MYGTFKVIMNKLKELICQYFPEHGIDDSSILIYTIELFYVGYFFFWSMQKIVHLIYTLELLHQLSMQTFDYFIILKREWHVDGGVFLTVLSSFLC